MVLVSALTVLLWCGNTALAGVIGDQGIVAILPLAVFFGTGILDKDDFNGFLWHVVMLAQVRPPPTPRPPPSPCHVHCPILVTTGELTRRQRTNGD